MLAHYGSFDQISRDPDHGNGTNFDRSWEVSLARYVQANPEKPIYADISFLAEVLHDDDARRDAIKNFKELLQSFPLMAERFVFGTDWTMVGQLTGNEDYTAKSLDFLQAVLESRPAVDRVLRSNFIQFAGLAPGQPTYQRIMSSYGADRALRTRLDAAVAAPALAGSRLPTLVGAGCRPSRRTLVFPT